MTQTRTVPVAKTRFLVREAGDGPGVPVLLLHGVPETSRMWRDVQPALATGRRVLAPDLPGLGGSAYGGPYDVPSLVAQLIALIEAEFGADTRVDVVGHDWGGVLALGLAEIRPNLIRRLCVVNAPYRDIPFLRAAHIPFFALPAVPELLFRFGGPRVVEKMIKLAWRAPAPLAADVCAEYTAAYVDAQQVTAMLGYYRAAARPRLAAMLPGAAEPAASAAMPQIVVEQALVLWGALDPVLPIATGQSVVRDLGPACAMITVPGVGHFVVEEAPEVVLAVLSDFLAEKPAPASGTPVAGTPVAGTPVAGTPAVKPVRKAAPRKAPAGTAPAKKAQPGRSQPKTGPAKGAGPSGQA